MDDMLSRRRILVVEDEMLVLMIIEEALGDLGCTSVTTAATVDDALALLDEQTFDAAILDVNLNGSKSYPIANALAARNIPFLFLTGYSGLSIIDGHQDRPILQKPFQDGKLKKILSSILRD